MENAISLSNVTKSYPLYGSKLDRLLEALNPFSGARHKPFVALKNLSLEIPKGQTVGIIGRNGSGKSTLLKLICSVLTPTSGTVAVAGKISALLELGAGFSPEMTGRENVYFTGAILGYTRDEMTGMMNEILSFASIGDFADQPVRTYSSGMFVRLAFAVSVQVNPDVLIVDEALAVGDLAFQAKCYRKFLEFKESGKTILFVSHGMDHILKYCDRAVLLDQGEVVLDGSPREAVDRYKALDSKNVSSESASKSNGQANEELLSYGNGNAEIFDFGLLDRSGKPLTTLSNGDEYTVRMKVRFRNSVRHPIFAFTIRDLKGTEITGANTLYQGIETPSGEAGTDVELSFHQTANFQPGRYSLCLGCTSWDSDLVVHHRLYDAVLFETLSEKRVVGVYDPSSRISIQGGTPL